ncbi:MAG: WbqC family protein, partial [Bacteroidota bacterium]
MIKNQGLPVVEESKETSDHTGILLELHYLPGLEYFALLNRYPHLILHDQETFQKQTYRNRCYMRGPNKVQMLSVPVTGSTRRSGIREVTINYAEKWHLEHLQTLRSAYGKAPYFEYYFEYFEQILSKRTKYLWDLNRQMLTLCLDLLNFGIKISESSCSPVNLEEVDNRYYGLINR